MYKKKMYTTNFYNKIIRAFIILDIKICLLQFYRGVVLVSRKKGVYNKNI